MSDPIYKQIKITGTSSVSSDEAVQNALARADKTVRHMHWFEVVETRGAIGGEGTVKQWQVTIEIGFSLDDGD